MGTRADFYIGRGLHAEWLGSIAWDGYPSGIAGHRHGTSAGDPKSSPILAATTKAGFRAAVKAELSRHDDTTWPKDGWPWPWDDSRTTDFAYAFDGKWVWASCFGGKWFKATSTRLLEYDGPKVAVFPNMKDKQNVRWDKGSGLIVIRAPVSSERP